MGVLYCSHGGSATKKVPGTRIQPASQARDVIDTYRLCAGVLFLRAEECETFIRSQRFLAVISSLNLKGG